MLLSTCHEGDKKQFGYALYIREIEDLATSGDADLDIEMCDL